MSLPLDTCPARRDPCPLLGLLDDDPTERPTEPDLQLGDLDPHRTARIDQQDIQAALASSGLGRLQQPSGGLRTPARQHAELEAAITRPTPIAPARPTDRARNRAALLGNRLAYWSVLPFFPIGFAAAALALIGLLRADRYPAGSGSEKAWAGLLTGLFFGATWLVLTLWIVGETR